eukprot:scaffold49463_cov65-Phaeocystis_antarctica.AAC.2
MVSAPCARGPCRPAAPPRTARARSNRPGNPSPPPRPPQVPPPPPPPPPPRGCLRASRVAAQRCGRRPDARRPPIKRRSPWPQLGHRRARSVGRAAAPRGHASAPVTVPACMPPAAAPARRVESQRGAVGRPASPASRSLRRAPPPRRAPRRRALQRAPRRACRSASAAARAASQRQGASGGARPPPPPPARRARTGREDVDVGGAEPQGALVQAHRLELLGRRRLVDRQKVGQVVATVTPARIDGERGAQVREGGGAAAGLLGGEQPGVGVGLEGVRCRLQRHAVSRRCPRGVATLRQDVAQADERGHALRRQSEGAAHERERRVEVASARGVRCCIGERGGGWHGRFRSPAKRARVVGRRSSRHSRLHSRSTHSFKIPGRVPPGRRSVPSFWAPKRRCEGAVVWAAQHRCTLATQ